MNNANNAYDVIVVGGGVVGASAAYHALRAGAKTLLIDRHDVGRATDAGAGILARAFYEALFTLENVGLAFLEARRHVRSELEEVGDLAAYGAILFGDAASQHRRDLAMAV
ncbi:MAG TPA: FAD-dependent oxidoreductase [Anaerolineae bacterium]|nr:FAD-dependent oxidoreductase [Anaerolineae bacterium]